MQIGLSLRTEMLDDFLAQQPDIAWLEVVAENYFSAGAHHDKLLRLRADYDLSLHCLSLNIGGTDALDRAYLRNIAALCKKFQPTLLSGHISYETHADEHLHDLLPIPFTNESLNNAVARVMQIQETLQRKILLENISYYVEYQDNAIAEVDFINALAKNSGAGLLLDLNNIWVNSKNRMPSAVVGDSAVGSAIGAETSPKQAMADFLNALQWDRVGEVHLAGGEEQDGLLIDTHGTPVPNQVLTALRTWQDKLQHVPIIYERDNNIPSFPDLISYLQNLL